MQSGVVAYDGNMSDRLPKLPTRSLSGRTEASRTLPLRAHLQAFAWLVPKLDARLVEIEEDRLLALWNILHEEPEPLPHRGRLLGPKKCSKKVPLFGNGAEAEKLKIHTIRKWTRNWVHFLDPKTGPET